MSEPAAMALRTPAETELRHQLARLEIADESGITALAPLEGGVSSDIWRLDLADGRKLCVKRALPRLKVAQVWEAPVARNHFEWEWFRTVAAFLPEAVPPLVIEDEAAGLFVMGYLPPARYPLWKHQLRDGIADAAFAASVGARLAAIHDATAGRDDIARRFTTDAGFFAIRLEPYLLATARAHPDRAGALEALARDTAATRRALVHGDVSPKNILCGPHGPVFLDAECAWYGDPAFDLAFCLNHLLLKCLWTPRSSASFLHCFDALASTYLNAVRYEPAIAVERRTAHLLPGLFLARIDGKSPVEYVTADADRNRVRHVARTFLARPTASLAAIRRAWAAEVGA